MARAYFDSVFESYPDLHSRLTSDAKIVEVPSIEAGISKVKDGGEADLTTSENQALLRLLLLSSGNIDDERDNGSIIERAGKSNCLETSKGRQRI